MVAATGALTAGCRETSVGDRREAEVRSGQVFVSFMVLGGGIFSGAAGKALTPRAA